MTHPNVEQKTISKNSVRQFIETYCEMLWLLSTLANSQEETHLRNSWIQPILINIV